MIARKFKTTQVSINGLMDKEIWDRCKQWNTIQEYNETNCTLRNMDQSQDNNAESKQPVLPPPHKVNIFIPSYKKIKCKYMDQWLSEQGLEWRLEAEGGETKR